MAFTDIHCHTFFKPNWLKGDKQTLLAQNIDIQIDPNHKPGIGNRILRLLSGGLKEILNSQSSLRQIHEGNGNVIVVSMTAMENAYANLDFCFFKNVFQFIQNIDIELLTKVGENQISYAEIIEGELSLIQQFNNLNLNGITYKIINRFAEIDNNPNVINVILSIEGGHGFYIRNNVFEQEKPENSNEIIEALVDWKQKAKLNQKPRLFYITPTHHAANCLANHAFAVPPNFAGNGVNNKAGGFNPVGNGITEIGEAFIRTALRQNDHEDRILIDLKHLSLRSRLLYYDLREQMIAEGSTPFPILASHMGVTGLSWNDRIVNTCSVFESDDACFSVHYDDSLLLMGFKVQDINSNNEEHILFNPWSINLYNEEVIKIVESKGLIGLSFDSRILGNEGVSEERFSKQEFNPLVSIANIDFLHTNADNNFRFIHLDDTLADDTRYPNDLAIAEFRFNSVEAKIKKDLLALCQNIIHIIRIGGNEAWNCICIGSDFDGIINPIDAVSDASKIPDMKTDFKNNIKIMVKQLNKYFIDKDSGENPIVIPSDFFEKFLFKNANQFLSDNF